MSSLAEVWETDHDVSGLRGHPVHDHAEEIPGQGAPIAGWGYSGSGAGQLCAPAGLAVDAADHVFVSERTASGVRLQKFDASGQLLKSVGGGFANCGSQLPIRVTLSAWNTLLLFDPVEQVLREYDRELTPLRVVATSGLLPYPFDTVAVATDAAGYIYLAAIGSSVVGVFRAAGTLVGISGTTPTQFDGLSDLEAEPTTGKMRGIAATPPVGRPRVALHELSWLPSVTYR